MLMLVSISCNKNEFSGHISTSEVSEISETKAICGGKVTFETQGADVRVLQKGIIWSISKDNIQEFSSDNEMNNTPYKDDSNGFLCNMTRLTPNTTYYVRAFAQIGLNEKQFVYGEIKEFSTTRSSKTDALVQTRPVSNITTKNATLNGFVTNAGNPVYSERGFCYSISSMEPTIHDTKKSVANPVAIFAGQYSVDIDIKDFTANSRYYIRAYVIQSDDVFYGETVELTAVSPAISSGIVNNITANSAQFSINLSNLGIPACSEWGVCYSTNKDFSTKKYSKLTTSIQTGSYTFTFNSLEPNTSYFYFVYAINSFDSICTDTRNFITLKKTPEMITMKATNITPNSVTIGGQILYAGTPVYTEFGILCSWRNSVPTINDFDYKEVNPNLYTDTYTVNLTDLIDGRTYYVRAYAVWDDGKVVYGDIVRFIPYSYIAIGNLGIQKTDFETRIWLWDELASACDNSILGGKKWRLPTLTELKIMYDHQTFIGGFHANTDDWIIYRSYWSSTTSGRYNYNMDFSDGKSYVGEPYTVARVRCVCAISDE